MNADPLRVLFDLLDAKAERGEAFTAAEARVDVDLGRERSQRDRAARWSWSRKNVRTLDAGGFPDPSEASQAKTAGPKGGPEAAQETAQTDQKDTTAAHDGPKGGPAVSAAYSFSCIPPGPPKGGPAPQGASASGFASEPPPGTPPTPGPDAAPVAAVPPAKPSRSRKPPMVRPDAAAVAAFAVTAGLPDHAEAFVDHFTSNGWKVSGRAPMQDWHAAYRGWCRREAKHGKPAAGTIAEALAGPFDAMTAKQAEAFGERHGLVGADFFAAGEDWRGKLFRARVDRLLASGVVTEADVVASQHRAS